jgi:hypothetical protein
LQLLLFPLFILCNHNIATAGDVSLAWDASTSPNISGYNVYIGASSRSYNAPVPIGNQTTYTVTGLPAGTYYFTVTAFDINDNESDYSNEVSQTIVSSSSDIEVPQLSYVSSSSITNSGVTIFWITDEVADTRVEYGITAGYGNTTAVNSSMVTTHTQSLAGLTANTLYHYRVLSKDAAGNLAVSGDYTFTTAASQTIDIRAPMIGSVTSSSITGNSATISWATDEAADTLVEYGITTSYGSSSSNSAMGWYHSRFLTGLTANVLYHYRVTSKDAAGNQKVSGDYTFAAITVSDTSAPQYSNVSSSGITSNGAMISWTTNEASDTQVEYGITTGYGSSTSLNSFMATSHSQALTGLASNSLYHYRVKSRDAANNLVPSGDYTFRTNTTSLAIVSINIPKTTDKSATITWITNGPADSEVDYWVDSSSSRKSALRIYTTNHTLVLNQLLPFTHYYCRVRSTDDQGNSAVSDVVEFNTTDMVASDFVMPRFSAGQNILGDDSMIGIGFTIQYSQSATLNFTAIDDNGVLTSGQGITNPVTLSMVSQTQLPQLDAQVFGNGLSNSNSNGWIKLESTTPDIHGLFLCYDPSMTYLDGANFDNTQLTDIAFTDIQTDGYNKISVINDNLENTTIAFDLVAANGTIRRSQSRVIPSQGSLAADVFDDLFPNDTPNTGDYIIARSFKGVQAFQVLRQKTGDTAALTAQDISAGSTILYAPQYASGGYIRTALSIINLDSVAGTVSFRFMGDDGVQLGTTKTLAIQPKGKLYIDDPNFFLTPAAGVTICGYVEVASNGVRLIGSSTFGDSNRQTFLASLALISNPETSLFYSKITSNASFFTGLAILNPNQLDTVVMIEAYDAAGTLIGRDTELLNAGQRISRLLTQYIPALIGKDQVSGYVVVTSDRPIASFSTLGTNNLSAMAAIAPTRGRTELISTPSKSNPRPRWQSIPRIRKPQ